ncbi:DAHP synthetase [Russula earlei]|uniref:DAHP synthetase n=1 Tax=Russula earlei TaxID=71964 RepID=A0ACC0U3S2_9AGAM|nr:DAHP synthetase [Russula earlei]
MTDEEHWVPTSWRSKKAAQTVEYPDMAHLAKVLDKVRALPPLVTPSEIERLRHQLTLVQRNEAFLLHAGDCAESFEACTQENISAKLGLILSFSLILIWGARLPVVRVGRIAGQYAKPRSSATEKVGDREIMIFRGDNVNGIHPDDRTPDPERLLSAYFHSTATLNHIRSLLISGFGSLHHPRDWSLSHVRSPSLKAEYASISEGLADALDFTRTIGLESGREVQSYERGGGRGVLGEADLYTRYPYVVHREILHNMLYISHEGLLLDYEEAMTRRYPIPDSTVSRELGTPEKYYNTSAHFLWVGDRTRQMDGAHIEYFRGIRNPIGIKVGPSITSDQIVTLLDCQVTLITRYGADKIGSHLAPHVRAVQASGHPVIWVCDPMHGNTLVSSSGLKTRHFGTIISELTSCLRIHGECNSRLGGVSLEFTGELNEEGYSVTECLGGSMELSEEQLGLRYQTFCDPRLNFEQSLDVAFLEATDVLYSELGGKRVDM